MTARDFLRARQQQRKAWIGTMLPGPPPLFRIIPAAPVASPATAPSLARPTAGEAGPISSPAFSDP